MIYYLPGHGGLISTGLGKAIADRGCRVIGRETVGAFNELPFQEQVRLVAEDLGKDFWTDDARVVANSFGGYLFLHAQALLDGVYPGRVLILSPIVGGFTNGTINASLLPAELHQLLQRRADGDMPTGSSVAQIMKPKLTARVAQLQTIER